MQDKKKIKEYAQGAVELLKKHREEYGRSEAEKRDFHYVLDSIEEKLQSDAGNEKLAKAHDYLKLLDEDVTDFSGAWQDISMIYRKNCSNTAFANGSQAVVEAVQETLCALKRDTPYSEEDLERIIEETVKYVDENKNEESLQDAINRFMVEKDLYPSDVYNAVDMDRRLFHRIADPKGGCGARKKNVIRIAIGLKLDWEETRYLLRVAGFSFNRSAFDVAVEYCLQNGIYDYLTIQEVLYEVCKSTLDEKIV